MIILSEDFKKKWNALREEQDEEQDGEQDGEFPKLLANAGHYSVKLDKHDKVTLYKRNQALTKMPLTIWQILCRQG